MAVSSFRYSRFSNADRVQNISHSIYVTNFSDFATSRDLWNACSVYGTVVDVFIPLKKSKEGKRFAFIHFVKFHNLVRLVENLCTIWIGRHHLFANQVRYERPRKNHLNPSVIRKDPIRPFVSPTLIQHGYKTGLYVNAVNNSHSVPQRPVLSSAPALVLDDECLIDRDLFKHLMGKVKEFSSIPNLYTIFRDEGFPDVKLTYLGGLWVMIECGNQITKDNMIKHKGVLSWFLDLLNANNDFQCEVSLINGISLNCTYGDGKPVTCCECEGPLNGRFCSFYDLRAGNSFAYDPNSNSFDDSQNLSDYPSQPQYETYLYELCGNDSHYGYDCPPRFLLVYEQEPSYNQNYDDNYYPHNSSSFLCCDNCGERGEHAAQISTPSWKCHVFYDDDDDDDDESLSDEDVPEENVKIHLNPLFKFDDEYISSDVNPLFDEVLEDIECDDVELLLHRDPSTPMMSIVSILEGFTDEPPLEENDNLFDLESKENKLKKILYDAPINDLMSDDKVFDPRIHENFFSLTYVSLPFEDRHYLFFTYVVRIFLPRFTYPVESPFLLSSGSEDTIFDSGISAFHISHRSGTFISFNVYPNVLNESLMEICSFTRFNPNITMIWEILYGEIKVHIEVLVLWGNRLQISDGSLPLFSLLKGQGYHGRNKTPGPWSARIPMWQLFKGLGVKEKQENDKIGSKPDKNGKLDEAGKSLKQWQLNEEEKPKKTKKEWPKTHTRINSY
nr:hypothetical protein [Tanacetum cinerariifolium]